MLTAKRGKMDALRAELEDTSNSLPALTELRTATKDLAAACCYKDQSLIQSAFCAIVRELIRLDIKSAEMTKEAVRRAWRDYSDGAVCEDFDEPSRIAASAVERSISAMSETRDDLLKGLEEMGCTVDNSVDLIKHIADMEKFRESILNDWPLTSAPMPSADRKMIADARSAIARGAKGLRRDDLTWEKRPSEKSE